MQSKQGNWTQYNLIALQDPVRWKTNMLKNWLLKERKPFRYWFNYQNGRVIFVWPWNENARTKQKQQKNGNRAIWLVYQTDTNAPGFWLVKVAEHSFGSLWLYVICQIMARERLLLTSWNLASEKCTDKRFWLTDKNWRFRSFHGNMDDWIQP